MAEQKGRGGYQKKERTFEKLKMRLNEKNQKNNKTPHTTREKAEQDRR